VVNIEQLREHCLAKNHVTECFPFDDVTLVFKVMNKMFALVPLERWERGEPSINLKCNPEYAQELRAKYDCIKPGFHMSKTHWNTILINTGELQQDFIFQLIDHSYDMVIKSMPKKLKDKF